MCTLDKNHFRVLRFIYHHPYKPFAEVEKKFHKLPTKNIGAKLLELGLVRYTVAESFESDSEKQRFPGEQPGGNAVSLFEGNIIVERFYAKLLTFFLPLGVSTAAFIVSFISLLI